MAILYGTQSNGETLPVQVNSFGQLVAQGLPGEKGDKGDPGPPGPIGNVEFTSGFFEPFLLSDDPSGEGFITYTIRSGYFYRFGPLLTVQVYLNTDEVGLTNIRGKLLIGGLPDGVQFARPTQATTFGSPGVYRFKLGKYGNAINARCKYEFNTNSFSFGAIYDTEWVEALWLDLEGEQSANNNVAFTYSGLARDSVSSFDEDGMLIK